MIAPRFPAHIHLPSLWISLLTFGALLSSSGNSLGGGSILPPNAFYQGARESAGESRQPTPQTRGTESKLVLGKASFPQEHTMAIPLFFTAAEGETVGRIHTQINVPEGAWKFRKVEPPKNSRLQVTAKQTMEEPRESGAKNVRHTMIELRVSAGSHAIRNGLIGHLQFSLPERGTPPPGSLAVRKLVTMPPVPEPEGASEKPLPLPTEPIPPAQGCFFFSH